MFTDSTLRFTERPLDCPVCHAPMEIEAEGFILFHCGQGFISYEINAVDPATRNELHQKMWRPGAIAFGQSNWCSNAFGMAYNLITHYSQDTNEKANGEDHHFPHGDILRALELQSSITSDSLNSVSKPTFNKAATKRKGRSRVTAAAKRLVARSQPAKRPYNKNKANAYWKKHKRT